jgi:hypothetical protein
MANVTLTIFKNINPNTKGSIYYAFDEPTLFYSQILINNTLATVSENDFRINRGTIIVAGNADSYAVYRKATYALERIVRDSGAQPCMIFYHVQKVRYECGKIYLDVTLDDFANGMQSAIFTKGTITRLNRVYQGGNYFYSIDMPTKLPDIFKASTSPYPIADNIDGMICIAQVRFVNTADFFGNSPISNTLNFVYLAGNVIPQIMHLGAIFQVTCRTNSAGDRYTGKAQLVQAWMIPKAFLPDVYYNDPSGTYIAYFKDLTDNASDKQLSGGYAYPHAQQTSFTYEYRLAQDLTHVKYIGTRGSMIAVPHELPYTNIGIETTLDSNGLKVLLRIGDQVTDITGQFALHVTYNNDSATDDEKVIGSLKTLTGVMSGLSKTYEKNGSMGVGYSLYSTFLKQYNFANPQPAIGDGDGDLTFEYDASDGTYYFPIRTYSLEIAGSVVNDAMNNGAETFISFNSQNSDSVSFREILKSLPDCQFLHGVGTSNVSYIKADVGVEGCPGNEAKAIADAFKEGIDIQYVQVSSSE